MGNYREGSDIDLTLFGNIDYEELFIIKEELTDSNIAYLVDLFIFDKLNSESLKEHING